jgi:parallel beta-helix repeat protein
MSPKTPLHIVTLRTSICLALACVVLSASTLFGSHVGAAPAVETGTAGTGMPLPEPYPAPDLKPAAEVKLVVDRADDVDGLLCMTAVPHDCTLRSAIKIANNGAGSQFYEIFFDADYTVNLTGPLTMVAGSSIEVYGRGLGSETRTVKINADNHGSAFILSGKWNRLTDLRIYGAPAASANVLVTTTAVNAQLYYDVVGDSDPADGCQVGSPNAAAGVIVNPVTAVCPSCGTRVVIFGNTIECNLGKPGNGITAADADRVAIGNPPGNQFYSYSRNTIRANAGAGISLSGAKATGNSIAYNAIGVNNAGNAAAPNGQAGIYLSDLASSTVITGNLISGNAWEGVWLRNTQAVTLTANLIGTDLRGQSAIPNGHDGVAITDGAHNTMVGSLDPAATATSRNLISGNAWCGLRIRDGARLNIVDGNWIGLNKAGTGAIPNAHAGVCVFSADDNTIGTSIGDVVQIISGNGREGIYIQGASGLFVGQTNLIGVASDKVTPLGNGLEGVMLVDAADTSIFPWLVAYNGAAGIALTGSSTATGNKLNPAVVFRNRGLPIDLGNDGPTRNDRGDADGGPNTLLNYPVVTDVNGNQLGGTTCANCTVYVYKATGDPARPGGGGILNGALTTTADATGVWKLVLPAGLTRTGITLQACAAPCWIKANTSELSPRPMLHLPLILCSR